MPDTVFNCRLPGAVAADDRDDLALVDVEGDAVRARGRAVVEPQVADRSTVGPSSGHLPPTPCRDRPSITSGFSRTSPGVPSAIFTP